MANDAAASEGMEHDAEEQQIEAPAAALEHQDGESEEESLGTEDASEPDEDSDDPWLEHPGADFLEEMEELWEMQHDDFSDSMPSDEWDEDLPYSDEEYIGAPPGQMEYHAEGWQLDRHPYVSGGWTEDTQHWSDFKSRTHHSQAADALNTWKNPQGLWELAVVTHRKLQLVRMQADGNIVDLGSFTFPSPPFSYSVARSHDGVTFAIGGDRGFLMIATFVEQREPRWRQEAGLVLGNPNVRDNNMLNGVRFARFGGKEYLMAAAQDGYVYLLANPNTQESALSGPICQAAQYMVTGPPSSSDEAPPTRRQVTFLYAGDGDLPDMFVRETYATGQSDKALNQALQSPCGRYVCLALDSRELWVADSLFDITNHRRLDIPRRCGPAWASPVTDECGAQYCAWSPHSRYLAASFDGLHWVGVWGVPDFKLLLTIEETKTPPLALSFSPSRPGMLAVCERLDFVYLLDVDEEVRRKGAINETEGQSATTLQDITIFWNSEWGSRGCIDGLGMTDEHLVLPTEDGMTTISLLKRWRPDNHKCYPPKFREAVRAFLMCACGTQRPRQGGRSVQDLPGIAVLNVIKHLAASFPDYFPPCAARPKVGIL